MASPQQASVDGQMRSAPLYRAGDPLRTRPTQASESMQTQVRPAHLPPRGPNWARRFAWWQLRRNGWDIRGLYPDASKFIIIGAPHTSNLDWYWGMYVQWALGVRFSFMIKRTFFFWPLSYFMRWLGGVSVDRGRSLGLVEKAISRFSESEKMVLLITPEGRTKPVQTLKRGFYEIAMEADVPVLVVSFRYDERVIALDGYLDMTGGFDAVEARLQAHYGIMRGRHRGYLNRTDMWAVRPLRKNTQVYR